MPDNDCNLSSSEWPNPADKGHAVEQQAKRLRHQVANGGLKFEAYLPPRFALWLLDHIEEGRFLDPAEATFVLLGQARELEPHADLRDELLKRGLQAALDDPQPGVSTQELEAKLREELKKPLLEAPMWEKRRQP